MQILLQCRSRQQLSNEYLLAKIGVDTAEDEPREAGSEAVSEAGLPWDTARGPKASCTAVDPVLFCLLHVLK